MKKTPLDPRLIGASAGNPFIMHSSSPRSNMFSNHHSQAISLIETDESIIQTGIERELGRSVFNKRVEEDSLIISIIPRLEGLGVKENGYAVGETYLTYGVESKVLDMIHVPPYEKHSKQFGFDYKKPNKKTLEGILSAGTIITEPHSIKKNGGYGYGLNANVVKISLREQDEDSAVISESFSKRSAFKMWETRKFSYGKNIIPKNIYGDKENYKIMPDIGESVLPSGLVASLMKFDPMLSPVQMTDENLSKCCPIFDTNIYVKGSNFKVVDINIIYTPNNSKGGSFTMLGDQMMKYVDSLHSYYRDIIETSEQFIADNPDATFSDRLHNFIVNKSCEMNPKLQNVYKKEPMNTFTVSVTMESVVNVGKKNKITNKHGGKMVISEVWPDSDMPVDKNGTVADILVFSGSNMSRLNIGESYEQYINAASRQVRINFMKFLSLDWNKKTTMKGSNIKLSLAKEGVIKYILPFIKIFGYRHWSVMSVAIEDSHRLKELVDTILSSELYVFHTVDSDVSAPQLVERMFTNGIVPLKDKIRFRYNRETVETKDKIMIGPIYFIVLNKIADTWSSAPSAKINPYGVPIAASGDDKSYALYNDAPVKDLSETESRIVSSYTEARAIAEHIDRNSSKHTHLAVYKQFLTVDKPSGIDTIVDREKIQFGNNTILKLVHSIQKCGGVSIQHIRTKRNVDDKNR